MSHGGNETQQIDMHFDGRKLGGMAGRIAVVFIGQ